MAKGQMLGWAAVTGLACFLAYRLGYLFGSDDGYGRGRKDEQFWQERWYHGLDSRISGLEQKEKENG